MRPQRMALADPDLLEARTRERQLDIAEQSTALPRI